MARRGSALERASAVINRGSSSAARKSALDSDISDDAAELTRFLSGLSETKSKGGGKGSGAVPAGLSDISISSDDDFGSRARSGPPAAPLSSGANKFMKSSKPANATQSKLLPVKSTSSNAAAVSQSPALLRLSQQTQRFLNKSNSSPGVRGSNSLHISEDSTIVSETSESIGAGGNKFLKSKKTEQSHALEAPKRHQKTPIPAHSLRTSTEDDSDMAAYIQRLSPSASEVSDDEQMKSKPPLFSLPQPISTAAAVVKEDSSFATETFSADSSVISDQRLPSAAKSYDSVISTDSGGAPLAATLMGIEELSLSPVATSKHSTKTSAPLPRKASRSGRKSYTKQTGAFSSLGLQSVDDLLATPESSIHSDVQSEAGRSIRTESSISSYASSPRSESSIHTYKDSVRTVSIDSEIRTHSTTKVDDYASDFDDTLRETESIATDSGSRSPSFYSDRTASSSQGHRDKSYSTRSHSTSYSRSRSVSRSYSRSISRSHSSKRSFSRSTSQSSRSRSRSRSGSSQSRSRSTSVSRSRSVSRSDSQSAHVSQRTLSEKSSLAQDYTSSFEDHLESTQEVRPCVETADAQVQTGLELDEMILKYYWTTDQAVPSVAASEHTKTVARDPAKVAAMAVSSEALDALTTYNPAMLALNDMMKQQVELSRQFLSMQQDMHKSIMGSIEREHVYTTLEDTYKFIESRRKPRLTFEQAVAMVKEEMNL